MRKIWHISDTHGYHGLLNEPEGIDMVMHSGDCSNYRDRFRNEQEVRNFITWYSSLSIKHKIYVAGNHDTSIESGHITKENFTQAGIIYLEHESIEIDGIKIFGSPYTPEFCQWAFNVRRDQLHDYWKDIPEDTDIMVTHGPPKGALDLAYDRAGNLEFCGDEALRKRINQLNFKLVLFGHIHNNEGIINAGQVRRSGSNTICSNGSVVTDGKFGTLSSHGNIFEI